MTSSCITNPWKRQCIRTDPWDDDIDVNDGLDIDAKRAALKISPSIVSLVSFVGDEKLFPGSGTIIESEDVDGTIVSTILTSVSLLRVSDDLNVVPSNIKIEVYIPDGNILEGQISDYDFQFNIATIKIRSDRLLPVAVLRLIDDCISINHSSQGEVLRPDSTLFHLCPGDMVVAVGRYFDEPYELMAAAGIFSLDSCDYDCAELFRASCQISQGGIGGPLVNRYGEVIGVNFHDRWCTPFLPINIVAKVLEQLKGHGKFCPPSLGLKMTNFYAMSINKLEAFIRRFPQISRGVLVEKVITGSPAEAAGILADDVIVQCCGKPVRSFLEFYGVVLDNVGESFEVIVMRTSNDDMLKFSLMFREEDNLKLNSEAKDRING